MARVGKRVSVAVGSPFDNGGAVVEMTKVEDGAALKSATAIASYKPLLSWERSDIERMFGFPAGRYTSAGVIFTLLLGSLMTVGFFAAIYPMRESPVGQSFFERGVIPYFIAFFTSWSLAILFVKWTKLRVQRGALALSVVPDDPTFVLSPSSVERVTEKIFVSVDDPKKFLLLHRILIALANLRNIGRVADVDDILRAQADNDASSMETSYYMVSAFVWAIPVLGFIGTVLGLSQAIGGFGSVLASTTDMAELKSTLQVVTGGLAVAFETTLQGLVAALGVQLLLTSLKMREEVFLDDCGDYCVRHVVNRLRLMPNEELGG